jgi:hypothetical protein
MERRVCLTRNETKAWLAVHILNFADYKEHYNKDCEARGFKGCFEDKFGEGVYAWYDQSGTALMNWTPIFEWVD